MSNNLIDWSGPDATHAIMAVQLKKIIQDIKQMECTDEIRTPIERQVAGIVDMLYAVKERSEKAKQASGPIEDRYNDFIQIISMLEEVTISTTTLLASLESINMSSTQTPS